jgi:hypothetical protein
METLSIPKSWIVSEKSNFISIFKTLEDLIQEAFIEKDTKSLSHYFKSGYSIKKGLIDSKNSKKEIQNRDILDDEIRYITGLIIMANAYAHSILNNIVLTSIEEQYNEYINEN